MPDLYIRNYIPYKIESQRIIIWEPKVQQKPTRYRIYYFIEVSCEEQFYKELGEFQHSLFMGNLLSNQQMHSESRQISGVSQWFPFFKNIHRPTYSEVYSPVYSQYNSFMNLDELFDPKEPVMETLTSDFCPWSATDGLGIHNLFSGLFFDGRHRGPNFIGFQADSDSQGGSEVIANLFGYESSEESCSLDVGMVGKEEEEEHKQQQQEETNCDPNEESQVPEFKPKKYIAQRNDNLPHYSVPSPASSETYERIYMDTYTLTNCIVWHQNVSDAMKSLNLDLEPQWKSFFYQTRWTVRFAPQQTADLSMTGIRIPPWRCSINRLMSDLCKFCKKIQHIKILVLLDPMVSFVLVCLKKLFLQHLEGVNEFSLRI